jgi:hypothetical protein
MSGSGKHGIVLPAGQGAVYEQSRSDVMASLGESTFFVYATHGEFDNFRPSYLAPANPPLAAEGPIKFRNPNHVTPAVGSRTDSYYTGVIPHHNIGILYACCILGSSTSWDFPFALGTATSSNTAKPNRAVLGFSATLWSIALDPSKDISAHCEVLLDELVKGKCVGVAVKIADTEAPLRSKNPSVKLQMIWRGDKFARIFKVYTGAEESSSWFLVLS